jgi:putative DNA primase/helicase
VSEDFAPVDMGAYDLDPADEGRRAELCAAAIHYASDLHFAVIPVRWVEDGVCSCPKGAECASPGKHPVHDRWPDVATADPLEAAHWWRPSPQGIATEWWPRANIGIVTGRKSGIWVLDVDSYNGGEARLAGYENRHGDLPATRVHHTGSGGVHYFFSHPGFEVRNSAASVLGAGLDVRGERGFVVAPPSVSAKGAYELNEEQDTDPVAAPEWLIELLRGYDRDQLGSSIAGAPPANAGSANRRYAEAALSRVTEEMRDAEPGERNDALNKCAFSLGTLGGAGLLDEQVAFEALRDAALYAGLSQGEIRPTFMSGWRKGMENPRQVNWQAMQGEWPARSRTEFGLADRMVDHWGSVLRWVPEWATWAVYQNGVWLKGTPQAGEWYAQAMIRVLMETEGQSYDNEQETSPDGTATPSPRALFEEWAAKQQTRKAVSSAARLCTGLPLMRMDVSSFDLDPMKLNVKNGVIDLNTGECLPHSPDLRMTLQADVHYRKGEPAPQWEEFLRRVQPDPEMRAYLQRVAGYCATGLTTEQAMFLWHGAGANGKSVAQAALAHVLGGYAQTMPVSTLMASTVDDRIPNDVARMAGIRFLVASETAQNKKLDEQRLKQLTGGDTVSARYMRAEWFEFRPVGKIQLTTNHLPRMSDDDATWRRIHLITWPVVIPAHERDGFLQERLIREESAGILNWVIEGALAWQQEGLAPPEGVLRAKEQYRVDEDVIEQFLDAMVDVVEPVRNDPARTSAQLFSAFQYWAQMQQLGGEAKIGQKAFTARLKKHGPAYKKPFEYYRSGSWSGFPSLQPRSEPRD